MHRIAGDIATAAERGSDLTRSLLAFARKQVISPQPLDLNEVVKGTQRMLERLLGYRVFGDAQGRMNRSLADTGGGLLLVPQFTLAADTSGGNRPGFSQAAAPDEGRRLYNYLVERARAAHTQPRLMFRADAKTGTNSRRRWSFRSIICRGIATIFFWHHVAPCRVSWREAG